jgi:3-oxo-5alpha-steroid 4-dehydrogenase
MSYGATLGHALAEKNEGRGWLILDARLTKRAWEQIGTGHVLAFQRDLARLNMLLGRRKAASLEALAKKIGVDPNGLMNTVRDYNRSASGQQADRFGKASADCAALTEGPFMAIDVGLAAKLLPCPTLTLGGLTVDEATGVVTDTQGRPIEGLYAAGRNAVGVSSGLYVSGLSIADGIFSGRRAGLHAARGITWSGNAS